MRRILRAGTSGAVIALMLLGLGACAKQEEPAAAAALPAPPTPLPPHAVSADDQLQGHLGELGATPSDGGWSVTFSSGRFRAGKVAFSTEEQVTIEKIISLLQDSPHLRVQIESYLDKRGAKAHLQELSQMQANAVLRDLTSSGVDESRVQAQGLVDISKTTRVEIIFSNAEGEFHPAPLENS